MNLDGTIIRDPLVQFCVDLAPLRERQGSPQPGAYTEATARALEILARQRDLDAQFMRKKSNPVCIDTDGAERAVAMREAVTAWAQGDVPPSMRGQRLLALNYETVMEGVDVQALNDWHASISSRYPHSYSLEALEHNPGLAMTFQQHLQAHKDWLGGNVSYQRLVAILHALRDAHDAGSLVVLYVDHIHRLLGGESERYPFDLASVLKPLLHRCQIQLWGACTLSEYRKSIESDASMERCFEAVRLPSSRTS